MARKFDECGRLLVRWRANSKPQLEAALEELLEDFGLQRGDKYYNKATHEFVMVFWPIEDNGEPHG